MGRDTPRSHVKLNLQVLSASNRRDGAPRRSYGAHSKVRLRLEAEAQLNSMTRPDKPSKGRPNWPVFVMSVGEVAGAKLSRFRMLNALKKLLRNSSLAFSPSQREFGNKKFFPKDKSSWVNPGPRKCCGSDSLAQRCPAGRDLRRWGN